MRFTTWTPSGMTKNCNDLSFRQRGVSILEVLIVIGLIAIIVAVFSPNLFRIMQEYRLETSAQLMAINLRFARNAAVKQKANYRVTIQDETHVSNPNTYFFELDLERDGSYVIYTRLDVSIPDQIVIKSGSVSQLEFDSRGRSSASGTIRLEGPTGTQYQISVSLNGGVSTEEL